MTVTKQPMWEILVPCQDNNGKPFRTRHHREWDNRVRRIAGGLTVLVPAKGQWVNKGTLYRDRVIPVRIACTEAQIEAIAKMTLKFYDQLAVMVTLISEESRFYHAG